LFGISREKRPEKLRARANLPETEVLAFRIQYFGNVGFTTRCYRDTDKAERRIDGGYHAEPRVGFHDKSEIVNFMGRDEIKVNGTLLGWVPQNFSPFISRVAVVADIF
jgi:hypothetical protein